MSRRPSWRVDLGLVRRVSCADHNGDVTEGLDKGSDLVAAHPVRARPSGGESLSLTDLDLGGPGGDERRVSAGFEGLAVAGELGVAVGDDLRAEDRPQAAVDIAHQQVGDVANVLDEVVLVQSHQRSHVDD